MFQTMRNNAAARFFTSIIPPDRHQSSEKADNNADKQPIETISNPLVNLLNPHGRIDYAIQENVLENPYMSALAVHTMCKFKFKLDWRDSDCAALVVRALYGLQHTKTQRSSTYC
jgi:hypothetical protein